MNKKSSLYKVFAILICLLSLEVYSQNRPQYTQYMYNTMTVNPGYTGSLGTFYGVGVYRAQWTGIEGAPISQNVAIHSPLSNEALGLGLNLANETLGPASQVFADANFSYSIKVSQTTKLGLGLKAGAKLLNVDFSKGSYLDPNDPLLSQNIDNRVNPTIGAGAFLYSDKWYLGLSVPDFISDKFFDDESNSVAKEEIQFYMIGGYVFDLSSDFKFKPAFLVQYSQNLPLTADVSANFLFKERFTLGVAYRYEDAVSGLAGFNINQSFFIGYSYDYTTSEFTNYTKGSHEIVLTYTLPIKGRAVYSPRFF
mgnify:CR=1 FL=1